MPDISMCKNQLCELKETCYRFTAKPSEFEQAYSDFKPDANGHCSFYWYVHGS